MLNLDVLDAISLTKGCYTGQEIVARTQNLGRIKRRMLRYRVATGAPPATLAALNHGHTSGRSTAGRGGGRAGNELLAVVSLDARDRVLTLGDGRELRNCRCRLPYEKLQAIPASCAGTAARRGSTAGS